MTSLKNHMTSKPTVAFSALLLLVGFLAIGAVGKFKTGLVPQVQAQELPNANAGNFSKVAPFSTKSLAGRYASLSTEDDVDEKGIPHHGVCIGVVTFDGNGNFTDDENHMEDGEFQAEKHDGTYQVNPDGSGVMNVTFMIPDGTTFKFDQPFVISDNGKKVTFIVKIEGVVSYGTLEKQ